LSLGLQFNLVRGVAEPTIGSYATKVNSIEGN
jgi:hypothetical protein